MVSAADGSYPLRDLFWTPALFLGAIVLVLLLPSDEFDEIKRGAP